MVARYMFIYMFKVTKMTEQNFLLLHSVGWGQRVNVNKVVPLTDWQSISELKIQFSIEL